MRVRAQAKWVRTSARKARLVLDHIRGRSVPEARTILAFTQRAAATDIEKVLRSAVANAEANHGLDGDDLVVEAAFADEGPTLKRWKPRARGRVNRIRKRTCHVTLVLAEVPEQNDAAASAQAGGDAGVRARGRRVQAEGRLPAEEEGGGCLMGQKVHPGGFRVGVIHDWKSNWWTGTPEFAAYLLEDVRIREHILGKLSHAGLSDILIRKDKQRITVDIYTARPGIVIGKSGVEVDALRKELHAITKKNVHININEIKRPELDAKLVAQSIAEQLENRVSFRRAMKRSLASAMRSGAQGIKITAAGRLGGGEMSRREMYSEGRVPLHTIRADIDYGQAEASTTFGKIGVKVWVNKGEIMPEGYDAPAARDTRLGDQDQARRRRGASAEGLGASREGRGRSQDREGLGIMPRKKRTQRPGGGRPGQRPRRDLQQGPPAPETWHLPWSPRCRHRHPRRRPRRRPRQRPRPGARADVDAAQDEVPPAPSRSPARHVQGPDDRAVRRVRAQGARGRLGHQPPDRGCPYRGDEEDPPKREGLDQPLPGQAGHEEAGRDPHGLRKGLARGVGRRREARPRDVRARRRRRAAREGGASPRRPEASAQDQVRPSGGRSL